MCLFIVKVDGPYKQPMKQAFVVSFKPYSAAHLHLWACDVVKNLLLWQFDDGFPRAFQSGKAFCFGVAPLSWHALNNMPWLRLTDGVKLSGRSPPAFAEAKLLWSSLWGFIYHQQITKKNLLCHSVSLHYRAVQQQGVVFMKCADVFQSKTTECATYFRFLKTIISVKLRNNTVQTYINS